MILAPWPEEDMTWLHGGNKELRMLCSTSQIGVCMLQSSHNSFIFLTHASMFEWRVVTCGFKNIYQKNDMFVYLFTILGLIITIIGFFFGGVD